MKKLLIGALCALSVVSVGAAALSSKNTLNVLGEQKGTKYTMLYDKDDIVVDYYLGEKYKNYAKILVPNGKTIVGNYPFVISESNNSFYCDVPLIADNPDCILEARRGSASEKISFLYGFSIYSPYGLPECYLLGGFDYDGDGEYEEDRCYVERENADPKGGYYNIYDFVYDLCNYKITAIEISYVC